MQTIKVIDIIFLIWFILSIPTLVLLGNIDMRLLGIGFINTIIPFILLLRNGDYDL